MSYSHLCISAPRTQIEQLPEKNIELKGFRQNMVISFITVKCTFFLY